MKHRRGMILKYLSEAEISKMPMNRIKNLRRQILGKINGLSGEYCCEFHCEYIKNEAYLKSQERVDDYAYLQIINKRYRELVE